MVGKKEDFFMVCPKCGSTNVYSDLSKDMMAWSASTRWLCKDCDYSAVVFPKMEKTKLGKFRKNIKLRTKDQANILDKQSISKGFLNKNVNKWLVFTYLIIIFLVIAVMLLEGFSSNNYFLIAVGLITLFGLIIILRERLK